MSEAIGIMGGTFDPIHFGHLLAAEEARRCYGLTRVIFIPNGQPPHKKQYEVTPAEQRYEMVVLATASNPAFETSRLELDRPGPSYAVETVQALRKTLGQEIGLYFITGADAIREILTWREPKRLLELCSFVAAMRPGYDPRSVEEALDPEWQARIHWLAIPGVDISSTELRRRAGAGESLRYLTTQAVARYIEAKGLYRRQGSNHS